MDKSWLWAGAGGAILVALLSTSKSSTSGSAGGGVSDADLTDTAKMLITETGFRRDPTEMAAIVQVAINRARARGVSLGTVVRPKAPPGTPAWNNSDKYEELFDYAAKNPRLALAKAFVAEVLRGQRSSPVGPRKHFVHPAAMPVPPCISTERAPRTAVDTFAGTRCLPPWSPYLRIGGALFA